MAVRQEWNIRRVLLVLSRWWWWPVLTISMGALSAWIYLRYTVAIYRSEATIQIDPKRASTNALTDKNSDYAAALDIISEKYIELFNDIQVLEEVVKQGDYHIDFYSVGRLGQFLIYPLPVGLEVASEQDSGKIKNFSIFIENVDDSTYRILRNDEVVKVCKWDRWTDWGGVSFRLHLRRSLAPGKYLLNYHSVQAAAAYWGERIRVMPKRGFTVLSVMVMDISPTRAQAFCQSLLQSVRHHEQNIQREYYDQVLSYIDTLIALVLIDIERVQDTIRKAETLNEFPLMEVRTKLLLDKYQDYSQNDILRQYEELEWVERQISAIYDYLDANVDSIPFLIIPPGLSELSEGAKALNDKIRSYNFILRRYARNSRYVLDLSEKIRVELDVLRESIQLEKRLIAHRHEYVRKYVGSGLPRLYRDIDSKRRLDLVNFSWESKKKIYELLVERRLQLSIERSGIVSLLRVTQPPTLPSFPLSPNKIQVYVALILLGVVIGIGGVFLREVLTQQVSYRRDIEPISPVPVIGELPANRKRERNYELGVGYLSNLQIEVLRSLRNSLDFLWDKEGPKLVIVTSTVSGEGKTYISSALAYVYALTGRRVLLIDADLRRAHLTQQQGLMQAAGLSTWLASGMGGREENGAAQPLWVNFLLESLYLLPSGPLPPNPAELLASPWLREFVWRYQGQFDYFIFDTSPVGLVPDVLSVLSQFPEAITLYVFRADYSKVTFLNHLEDIVKQHHLRKVYLLFNGTKTHRPHYGYGYGYGYYGEGYGASRYYYSRRKVSWPERVRKWIPL
jgi:tyrosine-protein kinase Etk/Wzc